MASRDISIVVKAVDQVTSEIKGMASGIQSAFKTIMAGAAALALGKFFKESVEEGLKAEKAYRELGQAVGNAGGEFRSLKPEIDKVVDGVQRLSNQTDDDLRGALTRLISTTGNVSGSLKNLGLVADVAAERHIALDAAADLVGKTMNGKLTPLTRTYGVEVKTVAEGMALLHTKTDGYAKLATEGLGGALTNLKIQWGEVKEALGLAITGSDGMTTSTGRLSEALIRLQKWIKENEEGIRSFIDTTISVVAGIGNLVAGIVTLSNKWDAGGKAARAFADAHVASFKDIVSASSTTAEAAKALTLDELAAIAAARTKATAAHEAAVKKSHQDLAALDKLANKAALELLSANQKAYEEVERTFREKMKEMTAEDYKKAEALLKQTHDNQLLAWAGFNAAWAAEAGETTQTWKKEITIRSGVTTDFNEVLRQHGGKLTEVTAAYASSHGVIKKAGEVLTEAERATIAASIAANEHREAIQRDSQAVVDGAQAFLGLARSAGFASVELEQLVSGITDIADGINQIAKIDFSKSLGSAEIFSLIGGISAGLGGIGTLHEMFFGESVSARNLRVALEQARYALDRTTNALGDMATTTASGNTVAGIIRGLEQYFPTFNYNSGYAPNLGPQDEAKLSQMLAAQGVSLEDLERIAQEQKVNLRPVGGRLNIFALREFIKVLGGLDTGTAQNWEGLLKQIQDLAATRGDTPEQIFNAIMALLAMPGVGSPFLANAFAGKSPAEVLAAIPGIIQNRAQVGTGIGGLNLSQFDSILQTLAGLARGIGGGTTGTGSGGGTTGTGGGGTGTGGGGGPPPPYVPPPVPTYPPPPVPYVPPITRPPIGDGVTMPTLLGGGTSMLTGGGNGGGMTVDTSINGITINVGAGVTDPTLVASMALDGLTQVQINQVTLLNQALAQQYQQAAAAGGNVTIVRT